MDPNRRSDKFEVNNLILTQMTSAQVTTNPPDGMGYTVGSGNKDNIHGQIYDKFTAKAQAIADNIINNKRNFPDWAYYTVNGTDMLIQASMFKPTQPVSGAPATATENYIYQDYAKAGSPGNLFHYIANTGDETTNGNNLIASMNANHEGIYYVDGSVKIGNIPYPNSTLIVNGRVLWNGNQSSINTSSSPWGFGISILAGGGTPNPAYPAGCANAADTCSGNGGYPANAYFINDGNRHVWQSILYVPNGAAELDGNVSMQDNLGPVVAWSLAQGQCGHPANNYHFGTCDHCWVHPPKRVTELHQ
jgi:hypothetical protein